ncbi:hypothetical protein CH278_13070 [Rhodococcus sp. 05-2254-5]|uniref:hypothetical protein n=1 Tax=unclassified Rhodococcus (in: high G+C Gram-positive bacteria) TaxID=192944 RepID=UPI000B9AD524|nr:MULTISPECIES: hypothetical protein [unclassified Rhodococcus (in: high G+C Gram-positive bacteria)]OZE33544.1 hypothetical protein CH278_13070 [Rhodococcus sp. 05-2254-5]OZE51063.1 hypothetical protein CH269_26015 [Rhodococcus sp. 05-2254-1]
MHEDHNAASDDNTRLYAGRLCDCRDYNCPAGAVPDLPCINEDTRGAPDNSPCEDHDCPTCYEHAMGWFDEAITGPPSITERIRRFLRNLTRTR